MESRIGNKFRVGRKIGSGSFGEIYLGFELFLLFGLGDLGKILLFFMVLMRVLGFLAGTNIQTNEEVAIKLVSAWLWIFARDNAFFFLFSPENN